ncbi:DUF6370 family protein [Flavobacterium sp. 5]|uniref:DUF6370 family protein n=1 Tax=Flavobacterium sp. 5 TaxID=2035199 RepID=UPI000C2B7A88|nr:DUF6370 family protein [Flavobacterium sp. 5]PKB16091.1 hypothetical protein CLU82_1209 [Flavobacterium sp. 5]
MKHLFSILFLFIALASNAQEKKEILKPQIVEVSCGQCQFEMKGKGCDVAIRIDGKSYFADGIKIDDYGDAHAKDGFCEAVREAQVTGKIVNNRFQVTSFKLLPEKH